MADSMELPYKLKDLNWDALHQFNSQNKYGYSGTGRLLSDPMLQCDMCEQWFFYQEVTCVPADASFVPFQRNYRFSCRICTGGCEQFELQTNTWTSIVLTAIYNMLLTEDGTSLKAGKYLKIKDIMAWVQAHWGSLTAGRNQQQLLGNSAISKCLLYTQNQSTFTLSTDRSEVLLRHVAPSKLQLKPLVSSQVPGVAQAGTRPRESKPVGGAGAKRKRGAGAKREVKEPLPREPAPQAPSLEQIKLPDKYRLLPVPKLESGQPQVPNEVEPVEPL